MYNAVQWFKSNSHDAWEESMWKHYQDFVWAEECEIEKEDS